jgi:hypothetical protein
VSDANGAGDDDGEEIKDKDGEEIGWSNSWNFKNKRDAAGTVEATSDGTLLDKEEVKSTYEVPSYGKIPTDTTMTFTEKVNFKGTLLKNFEAGGATVYAGSIIEEETDSHATVTAKLNLSKLTASVSANGRDNASWLYALTVNDGTQGVKIVFNATAKVSGSGSEPLSFAALSPEIEAEIWETASEIQEELMEDLRIDGTLKVYGAENREVFTLPIKDLKTLNEYLAYFGSGYYNY